MGWVTDDGKHEGLVYPEVGDGRYVAIWSAGAVKVPIPGTTNSYDEFPESEIVAWVVGCETCGWRGTRWERVTDPDQADWDAQRVYAGEDGWPPDSVEEAGHQEWLHEHVQPFDVLDELKAAARSAAAARRRLDLAVVDARDVGASWTDVGRATGMSRQSAHQRWGGTDVAAP